MCPIYNKYETRIAINNESCHFMGDLENYITSYGPNCLHD